MDSHRANVGFRRVPEGMGIRGFHRNFLNAAQGRTARDYGTVNGGDKMTIKIYMAAALLAAFAVHAVAPSITADPCAPVIECTQKELTE